MPTQKYFDTLHNRTPVFGALLQTSVPKTVLEMHQQRLPDTTDTREQILLDDVKIRVISPNDSIQLAVECKKLVCDNLSTLPSALCFTAVLEKIKLSSGSTLNPTVLYGTLMKL